MHKKTVKKLDRILIAGMRRDLRNAPRTTEAELLMFGTNYGLGLDAEEMSALPLSSLVGPGNVPLRAARLAPEMTIQRRGRSIPMHPDVRNDVAAFIRRFPDAEQIAIDAESGKHLSANGVTLLFRRLFRECGLAGYSINSGRKFFNSVRREAQR